MSRYSELMAIQGASYYWELNDVSGGAVATTGGVNLTEAGTVIYGADAVVGTGMRFTNASSYLSSPSNSHMNFVATQPFSYSFIMYVHSITIPMGLISKRVSSVSNVHFLAGINTGSALFFDLGANATRWTTTFVPVVGTWYHIAFTFNNVDNRYRLYVNGVMTDTTTGYVPTTQGSNAPIFIGVLGGSTATIARSTIDEVAVFMNKLLTLDEILLQYNTAFPVVRIFNGTTWADADRRML